MDYLYHLFYQNLKAFGLATGICCIYWVFEKLWPAAPDPGMQGRRHNLMLYAFILLGLMLSDRMFLYVLSFLPEQGVIGLLFPTWKHQGISGFIVTTLLYALVWDFFQYWLHRAQHAFPTLWLFHRVHHSDTMMQSSTSFRQSLGSILLGFFFAHIPAVFICGTNLLPILGSYLLFSGWGYFNHANIRLSLGFLTGVISGPEWHRLHHGINAEYHHCNYAAFFPIIDKIFGTLRLPKPNECPETGVADLRHPQTPLRQILTPLSSLVPFPPSSALLNKCRSVVPENTCTQNPKEM